MPSKLPCGSRIIRGKIFMDKKILMDYIDACELIKETEADIKRLNRKKKTIAQTYMEVIQTIHTKRNTSV